MLRFWQWGSEGERAEESELGKYTMGEMPDDLAFVVENGEAEFKIG